MVQNLILRILFLKILLQASNTFIFIHTFQWTSSEFFVLFIFSSRKSQSRQKLAKNVTHFTVQFRSKDLIHFTNLNSLEIMCSGNTVKVLSDFTNFPANIFLFSVRKTFGLHHFLTPKNCIFEAL